MVARVRGIPLPQLFDDTGGLLSGGKLYFYVPGTSDTKTVWKDSSKSTAHDQPVVLNSAGRPPAGIFAEGLYDVRIVDSTGLQVWTASNWGIEETSESALSAITMNAGAGLTGGGSIDQDRTFNVDYASQTEQEAGTETEAVVNPAVQVNHDSAAKAWVAFDNSGSIADSFGVSSVDDDGTANFGINFSTSFSSAHYAAFGGSRDAAGDVFVGYDTMTAAECNIQTKDNNGSSTDPTDNCFVSFYGDQ